MSNAKKMQEDREFDPRFEKCATCGGPIYESGAQSRVWVHEGKDDDHEARPEREVRPSQRRDEGSDDDNR